MKRLAVYFLATALTVPCLTHAQQEVLKPFRKETDKAAADTEEIPAAIPLKPFQPVATPKPAPAPTDAAMTEEENIPKAIPVRKPVPVPVPAQPAPTPAPVAQPPPSPSPAPAIPQTPAPSRSPVRMPAATPATPPPAEAPQPLRPTETLPAPTPAMPPRPANAPPADFVDSGDIVIRPGSATTADQVQLQLADHYFSKKQYKEATVEYERYLSEYSATPERDRQSAYYRLGESYRLTDALNNARANYESLLSRYNFGDFVGLASYRLAEMLYGEKDYIRALPLFRAASVRLTQPTAVNAARFFVARCLEASSQKSQALPLYEDLAKLAKDNPFQEASRLSVGRIFVDSKRRDDALAVLVPLSKEAINPQIKAEATARVGLTQLEMGKFDSAAETLNAAAAMPDLGAWKEVVHAALYRLLFDRKNFKGVIANYAREGANNISAENKLNILTIVASAHRELGQTKEALGIYEQIVRDFPTTPTAREAGYERLIILYNNGDEKLLDEVNAYLAANPGAPNIDRVSLMKAEALFKKGNFESAAPIYQIVVDKSHQLTGVHKGEARFKLGWSYARTGAYDKAIATFTTFLKEHPTHTKIPIALAQRGAAYMQLKQYPDAQKDFEELARKYPKEKEREFALENLALIQGQTGDNAKMAATFELLLQDYPETAAKAKAHYWVGRSAFDAKNYKKAAEQLDKARQLSKEQYFERSSLAIMGCYYNLEDVDATAKEIVIYKSGGGKAETPTDVVRWLALKYSERGNGDKAEQYFQELIARKETMPDDYLQLARSRVRNKKYKESIESFDIYLATINEPAPRARCLIEKADAQLAMSDWPGVEKSAKEALTLQPEGKLNGEARIRAGEAKIGQGNHLDAARIFEGIALTLEDDEVTPRALEMAIQARRQLGAAEDVQRLENELRTKYPEYAQRKKP